MSIKKRVRVSFRYVRRVQTNLWDCIGPDVEENLPEDAWREAPVYVDEHDDKSEWIYVQVEQPVQPQDEMDEWLAEAEEDARVQADQAFWKRHPGSHPVS